MPKANLIGLIKQNGIKIISFAPTAGLGKKLVRMGVDALIIEGMEAGGHIGPVSTIVLAQEILPTIKDVPIFVAGGIGRGEVIAKFLEMGAAGCQLGTRFVCAQESIAHPNFKEIFIRSSARDAVSSTQLDDNFTVIPVRAIANEGTKEFNTLQRKIIKEYYDNKISKQDAQYEIEKFWVGALRRAVIEGDVVNGSVMAGQSVGMVNSIQTVQEIIKELLQQTIEAL